MNHTECDGAKPAWEGSPDSAVAKVVFEPVLLLSPVMVRGVAKKSWSEPGRTMPGAEAEGLVPVLLVAVTLTL